jgi:hypothetical protein
LYHIKVPVAGVKLAIKGIQGMKTTVIAGAILSTLPGLVSAASLNTARIDELTGLKGKFNEKEGVYKVTFPRDDVKTVVDGWTMPPFMGLGNVGCIHADKRCSDCDGRYGSV